MNWQIIFAGGLFTGWFLRGIGELVLRKRRTDAEIEKLKNKRDYWEKRYKKKINGKK